MSGEGSEACFFCRNGDEEKKQPDFGVLLVLLSCLGFVREMYDTYHGTGVICVGVSVR